MNNSLPVSDMNCFSLSKNDRSASAIKSPNSSKWSIIISANVSADDYSKAIDVATKWINANSQQPPITIIYGHDIRKAFTFLNSRGVNITDRGDAISTFTNWLCTLTSPSDFPPLISLTSPSSIQYSSPSDQISVSIAWGNETTRLYTVYDLSGDEKHADSIARDFTHSIPYLHHTRVP